MVVVGVGVAANGWMGLSCIHCSNHVNTLLLCLAAQFINNSQDEAFSPFTFVPVIYF